MRYWLVMPAAGAGRRFGGPKLAANLAGRSVLQLALRPFLDDPGCAGGVIVGPADLVAAALPPDSLDTFQVAAGGAERVHSVLNGLRALAPRARPEDWVLVHDAARPCLTTADLSRLLREGGEEAVGAILARPVADTLKSGMATSPSLIGATVSREGLWAAMTPQMFRYGLLISAIESAVAAGRIPTDEAQAMEALGHRVRLVAAQDANPKVTTPTDLQLAAALFEARGAPMNPEAPVDLRVGTGFDAHRFGAGDSVVLGGVRIPHTHGVIAHSDGDVLLHALVDALLGAAGLGDIGQHFSDRDPRWRGIGSEHFVRQAMEMLGAQGWSVVNADMTLLSEAPRISSWRQDICSHVAELLNVDPARVNLKATTTEGMGFVGRSEGLAAMATVMLTGAGVKPATAPA